MYPIQILLPTADNAGHPFPRSLFTSLRHDLTSRFGSVTVYARGLAEGFWEGDDSPARDDVVLFKVIADDLDTAWWRSCRESLERDSR